MFLRSFFSTPGSEQTRPREGASLRSPLAELGTAPVMRRGQRRAAVQVGRGATAISWEAEWRSGVAAVFWVYYNKIFSKIRLDITTTTTTTTEEHYIVRIRIYRIYVCYVWMYPCSIDYTALCVLLFQPNGM